MSYFGNVMAACPNLQAGLNEMWITPGAFPGADERMPFAEFLNSPFNRHRISYEINPGQGKVKTVELVYQQRMLESAALYNQANPKCTATTRVGENISTYTLDTDVNVQVEQTSELTDYEGSCTENSILLQRQVARMIDGLDRIVATQQTNQASALSGNWGASVTVNGSNQFVINTLQSVASQTPAYNTWSRLRNALDDSGFPGDVLVVGGTTMRDYFQWLQAGCCSDQGVDLGEMMAQYGYAYAYDKRLQNALGSANEFMVIAPGALQPISSSRAEGKAAMGEIWGSGSNYFYSSVRSPRHGVPYDFTAKDNCGTLSLALTYTGKVIAAPNDMFAVGDEYEGVTCDYFYFFSAFVF